MKNHGEGNHKADQNYREGVRETVENEDVTELARDAEPADADEAEALKRAEAAGRDKAKEFEPGSDTTEN